MKGELFIIAVGSSAISPASGKRQDAALVVQVKNGLLANIDQKSNDEAKVGAPL
jgi:hypothetical protein